MGHSDGGTRVGVNVFVGFGVVEGVIVGVLDGVMVGDDVGVTSAVWVANISAAISVARFSYDQGREEHPVATKERNMRDSNIFDLFMRSMVRTP